MARENEAIKLTNIQYTHANINTYTWDKSKPLDLHVKHWLIITNQCLLINPSHWLFACELRSLAKENISYSEWFIWRTCSEVKIKLIFHKEKGGRMIRKYKVGSRKYRVSSPKLQKTYFLLLTVFRGGISLLEGNCKWIGCSLVMIQNIQDIVSVKRLLNLCHF